MITHPLFVKLLSASETETETKGAFQVTDNRVLNGPNGRSLHLFARTAHSVYLLCSIYYASFARLFHARAGLLHSILSGMIEFIEYVFTLYTCSTETIAFVAISRGTP